MDEKTREQWLNECAELLWPKVIAAGGEKPERYRVSCGWPSRSPLMRPSAKSRRIGECWSAGSEDKAREIFISPALANPVEVADVLLHELIHAALPERTGHRHPFPAIAKKLGLEGKPTATFAGEALAAELKELTNTLGTYPHAKLDASVRPKQQARQMLVECPDCGCKIRMARSWIDRGLPKCACGSQMTSVQYDDGSDREPLVLKESHATYLTEDGLYELSSHRKSDLEYRTAPTGQQRVSQRRSEVEPLWFVTDLATGRIASRRSRQDALAFIEAVRNGVTDFPEIEDEPVDDDFDLEGDELGFPEPADADHFIEDDELEMPDYEDGHWNPAEDEYPLPEAA